MGNDGFAGKRVMIEIRPRSMGRMEKGQVTYDR